MRKPKITYGWTKGVVHTPNTWWAHNKILLTDLGWSIYTIGKWLLYALLAGAVAFGLFVVLGYALGLGERLAGL